MVIFLFLASFCILFFLPVQFRLHYRRVVEDDNMVFEMSFLNGWLKRKWEIDLFQLTIEGIKNEQKKVGNWFFWRDKEVEKKIAPFSGNSRGWREFLNRFQHFGLGLTLLTYILPGKYRHWLMVVDRLERRGQVHRFFWKTNLGMDDAAVSAYLTGILWGIKTNIVGFLSSRYRFVKEPEIMVVTNFQSFSLDTVFDCIFRVKLGYIIIAAFIARLRYRLLKGGVGIE